MNARLSGLVGCALGLVAAPLAMSLGEANPTPPVVKVKNATFGNILQSKNRLPLYYWSVEKRAGGKVRCTGKCARVWPPLLVRSRTAVPSRLAGVRGVFGVELRLTTKEFDLLWFLASHPRRVFSRDQLMASVWGYSAALDSGTVTVHVRRLREKIEDLPSEPRHLQTVWGVGYRHVP